MRHYWATAPPANASLEIEDQSNAYTSQEDCFDMIGLSDGLKKLERVVLESPPELNSAVVMQLVGNPKAMASNLTTLDLRFCRLDNATLAQLLYHAPPNLKRLSLLRSLDLVVNDDDADRAHFRRRVLIHRRPNHGTIRSAQQTAGGTHLCPLIRQFSRRLERLDYGSPHVCRQLFFDDDEIQSLHENGITTKIGGNGGQDTESEKLDTHALENTIRSARQRKRTATLETRIREALDGLYSSPEPLSSSGLFGASSGKSIDESKVRREIENLLDDEEGKRQRLVNRPSRRWSRRIIAWESLCEFGDTWEEMKLAADLEERGIEWVLASMSPYLMLAQSLHYGLTSQLDKALQVASQHTNGELPIALNYERALEENFELEYR